jgi:invasion protein IalB
MGSHATVVKQEVRMKIRSVGLAPKGTRRRAVTTCVAAALTLAIASDAGAQQATPPAAKPQPKKPAAAPAAPAAPTGGMPQGMGPVQEFVFSPWTKFCGKDGPDESNAKNVCGVVSEARVDSGQVAAAVVLVEPGDGSPRILRLTLPLGVRLPQGTRIIFDQGVPAQSNYLMCIGSSGCISDYEANADVLTKMRKAQTLTVQAVNPGGYPIGIDFSLKDFAKADDGPATDPKTVAEQSQKLQDGLKNRAEEVRKQMEGAPQGAAPSTPSAK